MGSPSQQSNSLSIASATYARYAPYVENNHANFLGAISAHRDATIDNSPYSDYTDIEINDVYFGVGNTVSSFNSLYELYGTKLSGLDVDTLWSESFNDIMGIETDLVDAERDLIEIGAEALNQMYVTMRKANAIQTSTFIMGKALIERKRLKQTSQYSNNLKYNLIPDIQEKWKTRLNWDRMTIRNIAALVQAYHVTKINIDKYNYDVATRDVLWPFTVLDHERAALSVLQGSSAVGQSEQSGRQMRPWVRQGISMVGWGMMGAYMGAEITGEWIGAVVGAIIGIAAGYLISS